MQKLRASLVSHYNRSVYIYYSNKNKEVIEKIKKEVPVKYDFIKNELLSKANPGEYTTINGDEQMEELLKELAKYWNLAHDHPMCDRIHDELENTLSKLSEENVIDFFDHCTEDDLSMIYPVVENLAEYHNMDFVKKYIR